jgi:dTDP-4-dehydrorhamnose 3,5-epimerase
VGVELTADNRRQLWIPPGLAHGFLVLSDVADVLYKTTTYFLREGDRSIAWNDPTLAVAWPLTAEPILSAKDATALPLTGQPA